MGLWFIHPNPLTFLPSRPKYRPPPPRVGRKFFAGKPSHRAGRAALPRSPSAPAPPLDGPLSARLPRTPPPPPCTEGPRKVLRGGAGSAFAIAGRVARAHHLRKGYPASTTRYRFKNCPPPSFLAAPAPPPFSLRQFFQPIVHSPLVPLVTLAHHLPPHPAKTHTPRSDTGRVNY